MNMVSCENVRGILFHEKNYVLFVVSFVLFGGGGGGGGAGDQLNDDHFFKSMVQ
jgi:hypothetical protein